MEKLRHPLTPASNVAKFGDYDPANYTIADVSRTVTTNEALNPGCPPRLTQQSIAKCLTPLTRELTAVPARPSINELPDAVIEHMVRRDKAFWVDKPGVNDYTIHDSYYDYGLSTEVIKPVHQDPFPRSYQYDLDCVRYRRTHACDGLVQKEGEQKKSLSAHCRDCQEMNRPAMAPFQLAWAKDPGHRRWRYYPDLTATLTREEIRASMDKSSKPMSARRSGPVMTPPSVKRRRRRKKRSECVGRPFQNEACNWYYQNYPPVKYDCIVRKFSQ